MRWGAVHLLMSSWVCRIDSMALWISLRSVPFFLRRLLCLLLCPGWKIWWVFGVLLACLCACLTYSRCLKSPGGPAPETSSHFLDFYVCHSYVSALVPSPNQTHTPTRAGLSHVSVVMLWLRVWSVYVIHRYFWKTSNRVQNELLSTSANGNDARTILPAMHMKYIFNRFKKILLSYKNGIIDQYFLWCIFVTSYVFIQVANFISICLIIRFI